MPPVVSIVLPVWNSEETLEIALASVLRQSFPHWVCHLLDDGSTDRSLAIAQAFARRDSRFQVEALDHQGLLPTLNHGVALCDSPLVARMDADDWMHHDRLALQVDRMDRSPELDAVGCGVRLFPRGDLGPGRRRYENWLNSLSDPRNVWRDRYIECPIAHPTLMIRQSCLTELGYVDRGWPEDFDLMLRLLQRGPVAAVIPKRLHGWRNAKTRLSRTDQRYAISQFTACRAWHLHHDFLAGRDDYILWGYGRTGRELRRALEEYGHRPDAIVDVHPGRAGHRIHGAPVIAPETLSGRQEQPILVSVAGSKARGEIRTALSKWGYRDGVDYLCVA